MDDENMDDLTDAGRDGEDARLDRAIALLRADVRVDAAAFDARVLAAIRQPAKERATGSPSSKRAEVSSNHTRVWKNVWIGAVAMAASIVVAALAYEERRGDDVPQTVSTATLASADVPAGTRLVHFRFSDAHAARVAIAGSFNGWSTSTTPLRRVSDTTWAADIPLSPGRHVYQFVIDNHRWVPDPAAPRDPGDDFGSSNSVVTVVLRSRS